MADGGNERLQARKELIGAVQRQVTTYRQLGFAAVFSPEDGPEIAVFAGQLWDGNHEVRPATHLVMIERKAMDGKSIVKLRLSAFGGRVLLGDVRLDKPSEFEIAAMAKPGSSSQFDQQMRGWVDSTLIDYYASRDALKDVLLHPESYGLQDEL